MLPYGTGICCYAFMYFFLLLLSIPFLYLKKSGIDKSAEWSTIPACSKMLLFLPGAIPKGLILRQFCV